MIDRIEDESLESIAARLGERMLQLGLRLTTAESCTGGWVAKTVTDIAGSSAWFDRGFVTYSNAAKQEMLGVASETLDAHGAVSEPVAKEMVAGALARSQADTAVAITGIAGPGGGSVDKPVGTVWFAWGMPGQQVLTGCDRFDGDRDRVRQQAVRVALEGLLEHLRARV
ncbi:damage-inducible protein CinA [Thiocystis minor]|uniref:nicotinamide-nucleotide amidase n=1 Tax=Thiocystis minor TaxID=61597 RepID=UPI00191285F1|nr:nicotinamide-nucleotide amidase [Thiocystis minor]MBK5962908.1 damage-inducible protein CinA [Thiocystis minor]